MLNVVQSLVMYTFDQISNRKHIYRIFVVIYYNLSRTGFIKVLS